MNLPQEIKDLYNQHSIPKRFRLHFPNGERPDILNENIEEESMVIHQRLCSQERLKFGMCESTTIECDVFGIENKWIIDENGNRVRNPDPLRGNIKGCEVEVIQEIDISSCSPEFIEEYGKTAEDVPWPFYEVPFGRYIIESCQKTANMDTRKITGYDALNASLKEKSLKPWAKAFFRKGNGSVNLDDMFASILAFNGIVPEDYVSEEFPLGELGAKSDISPQSNVSLTYDLLDKYNASDYEVFNEWFGTLNEIEIPQGKYRCMINYDKEQVNRLNNHLMQLGARVRTIDELVCELQDSVVFGYMENTEEDWGSETTFVTKATSPEGGILSVPGGSGLIACFGGVTICKEDPSIFMGRYGSMTPIATYQVVRSIQLFPVAEADADGGLSNAGGFEIQINAEDFEAIPDDDFTVGNILGGILEINGLFGMMTSKGLVVRQLDSACWELSENWLLESEWVLNDSPDTTVASGTQEEAWYDEDSDTGLYGTVRILGEANVTLAKYTGSSGYMVYNIENNPLFLYFNFSERQMVEICKKLQKKICSIKWTPATVSIMSRPYLNIGDRIAFDDDGERVCTYIFDKITSGIVSMQDEVDSTMVRE